MQKGGTAEQRTQAGEFAPSLPHANGQAKGRGRRAPTGQAHGLVRTHYEAPALTTRPALTCQPGRSPRGSALTMSLSADYVRHVARMSQEPAECVGTGRDDMGRGGITTPSHSGRLRGKGAILLEVSHRPARVRFPPPPHSEAQQSRGVAGLFLCPRFRMCPQCTPSALLTGAAWSWGTGRSSCCTALARTSGDRCA